MHAEDAKDVVSMPRMLEAWWYTTPLASQLIRQQVGGGGGFFDVGLLGTCKNACRGRRGRCKACRGRPRTLPSMPRSYQASLHILGSHRNLNKIK